MLSLYWKTLASNIVCKYASFLILLEVLLSLMITACEDKQGWQIKMLNTKKTLDDGMFLRKELCANGISLRVETRIALLS